MSDSKAREQFEAWEGPSWSTEVRTSALTRNQLGRYRNASVQDRWEGWQASRAAALEEAVAALEGVDPLESSADWDSGESIAWAVHRDALKAIRALAGRGA